jgi:putative addiction module CopG family antidote
MANDDMKFNICLTADLQKFVTEQVYRGHYSDASEVIADSLRLLRLQEDTDDSALEELREKLRRGAAEADRGDLADGEQFLNQLIARLRGNVPGRSTA